MLNKNIITALVLLFSASSAIAAVTKPGAPRWVSANADSYLSGVAVTNVTVTFSPPASNGGATITNYTVSCTPACTPVSSPTAPIRIEGLTAGIEYTFTVTATNSAGTGLASSPSNSAPKCDGGTSTDLFNADGYVGKAGTVWSHKIAGGSSRMCDPAQGCDSYHLYPVFQCSNYTGTAKWVGVMTGAAYDNSLIDTLNRASSYSRRVYIWGIPTGQGEQNTMVRVHGLSFQ